MFRLSWLGNSGLTLDRFFRSSFPLVFLLTDCTFTPRCVSAIPNVLFRISFAYTIRQCLYTTIGKLTIRAKHNAPNNSHTQYRAFIVNALNICLCPELRTENFEIPCVPFSSRAINHQSTLMAYSVLDYRDEVSARSAFAQAYYVCRCDSIPLFSYGHFRATKHQH